MDKILKIASMRNLSNSWKKKSLKIGFVPTMGALHAGHASLIKRARKENNKVVVSIFVNPIQFGPREDLSKYPRPFAADARLCQNFGADVLFSPAAKEIYPDGFCSAVLVEGLSDKLCGQFRPGHFQGVATIVLKLFQIVSPSRAYFGEKDYQQLTIIRRLAQDLHLPVSIVGLPTVREKDGLALSSRNRYLSSKEREMAPLFYQALSLAAQAIRAGTRPSKALAAARREILNIPGVAIEYVSFVDGHTLEEISEPDDSARVMSAIRIGITRLIDNVALSLFEKALE